MKKILLYLLLCFPLTAFSQNTWNNLLRKSVATYVFKITALDAEKYIVQDSIPVEKFTDVQPILMYTKEYINTDSLPIGYYVLIRVLDNAIETELIGKTNLIIYPLENQQVSYFEVRDKQGNNIDNASVWIDEQQAVFNTSLKQYAMKQKRLPETPFVKVYASNDTAFASFEYAAPRKPIATQKWKNFTSKKWVKTISWLPKKILQIFKRKKLKRYQSNLNYHRGYILFNQAKYKINDTVKLKAHIITKRNTIYDKPLDIYLNYYRRNKVENQYLSTIAPTKAGSYIYEFKVSDTLMNDIQYSIQFIDKQQKKIILTRNFKVEDYVLEDITNFSMKLNREKYFYGDSVVITANAKDANNLPILDASAKLIVTSNTTNLYEQDSIYIADTIYVEKQSLLSNGDNQFIIPASTFQKASVSYTATIEFENSNHEIQTRVASFEISTKQKEIRIIEKADSIYASYFENGVEKKIKGEVEIDGENNIEQSILIEFPVALKIDPLAEDYDFYVIEKDSIIASTSFQIRNNYQVYFQRLSNRDSVGFILLNTHKIPVTYLVFDGKKVIAAATSLNSEIMWKKVQQNERKLFTVQYSFVWGGKQIVRNEKIGLLYKVVDISVQHQSKIFPGQKDSITVTVKDYKNKAVENFNLTAVAYNSQLSKYIYVPELPYLAKYTQRKSIDRGKYEMESKDAFFTKKYPLYKHPKWIAKMGLDTLLYYQLLFPKSSNTDIVIPISKFIPEASIHVVDKGMPQPIYLLYINQEIVYYNAVKAIMPYSFKVNSFYNKIGIRLIDKYIEIDSVYIQPNYKHDIVFDLQQLPAQATVIECPKQFTNNEVSIIERSFLQLDNRINAGYLWQKNSVFNIQKNEDYNRLNIIGPLNTFDSVHYFLPKIFDVHFKFEPGYFYHLSNKVIRLEKKSIFPFTYDTNQYNLPEIKHFTWQHLGDTILNNPTIYYEPFVAKKIIKVHERNTLSELFTNKHLTGKLFIKTPKDTAISYTIIETFGTHKKRFIYAGCIKHFTQLHPEMYTITYITSNWLVAEKKVLIQKNTTLYIHENSWHFAYNNALIDSLFEPPIKETKPVDISLFEFDKSSVKASLNTYPYTASTTVKEKGILKIKVLDIIGKNPIPHVAASIKNTKQSYLSDINGELTISNIKPAKYTISISTIGYQMLDIEITIEERLKIVTVQLQQSTSNLDEVVVVGYGMTRRKDMTGSMSLVKSNQLFNNNNALTLQGRVAGVQINGNAGSATNITIRGMKSLEKENILYVIDGILYDEMPEEITPEIIDKIETLNSKEATNLYGLRAASGAIVISTKNKTLRTIFRDYAFWQPELVTNSEGKVAFTVNYPDNITSWDAYFLGMDAKNRIGKLNTRIQSYKPIMAQLSIPTFLIEGDSTHVISKILNHTNDPYQLTATFSVNNILQATKKITAAPNASVIIPFEITGEKDTVQNSFEIITNTGFKDGEERKIPVFKKGIETTIGNFWILQKDTTIKIEATQKAGTLKISAVNNTLDVLLDEIEQVKKYPYYCMEQTASKLRSLLMEKTIKHALHKKFADEATIKQLTKRILDGQNFNGGWGWWQAGKTNIHITNYIIEILQEFKENTLLNNSIRNGLLYLQNQLDYLGKDELLHTLCILSESNHAIQYEPYLKRFEFDSLTIHQQWQWVRLLQNLKLDYSKQIDTLLYRANKSMLGSMYWGKETYCWYNNQIATTLLAYKVVKSSSKYEQYKLPIIQHFLSERRYGHWANTYASASIVSAILPDMLKENKLATKPSSIEISGDTNFVINQFPFMHEFSKQKQSIKVQKMGGGLTYFSSYENFWNETPTAFSEHFNLNSYFERNGDTLMQVQVGEKTKLIVSLQVKKDAEYVMIEVPIPAGCNYASKWAYNYGMHKEFFKNKVCFFAEKLSKGTYEIAIDLEPRYTGTFTLNPAKASLMYFPTFYGNNNLRSITIH